MGVKCYLCGEELPSKTARTMHIQREKCPEVSSEEDKYQADAMHLIKEIVSDE